MSATKNWAKEKFEWTIKDYEPVGIQDVDKKGKLASPIFGPPEQPWRLWLMTKDIGFSPTHLGLFIEAITSPEEERAKVWTRNLETCEFSVRKGEGSHYIGNKPRVFGSGDKGRTQCIRNAVRRDEGCEYLQADGSLVIKCKLKYERLPQHRFARSSTGPSLLFSEELSDIQIVTTDGFSIPAHRAFLHASAYFRAHASFSSNQGTAGNQLNSDFSSLTVRSMLEFLYMGSLITHAPQSPNERRDLIRLADMYQIPNLHALVAESTVANDLNEKNARELLVVAHKHGGSPGGLEWITRLDPDLVKILYANEGGNVAVHESDSK
ncbi:hypothetical protein HK104_004439 [Borealophlyctis nickersoniae]|nr:hypothetical protein HK104_004439 [Borealophlyctis nickersoniae]